VTVCIRRGLHPTRRLSGRSCVTRRMILTRKGAFLRATIPSHHITPHTSRVTAACHTSHVTRHTSHVTRHSVHQKLEASGTGTRGQPSRPRPHQSSPLAVVCTRLALSTSSQAGVHGALGQHRRARTAAIRYAHPNIPALPRSFWH
jgi:hypothetical protein